VLYYPPDFQKDRKYPLVLIIHGGPQASATTQFSFLPQLMVTHGYVVFSPNYRGSDNLGNAYQRAIWNDAGDGPGRDVIAGIDALKKLASSTRIKSRDRLVLRRLYDVVAHRPLSNLESRGGRRAGDGHYDEYNLSDGNVSGRYSFKGSLTWAKISRTIARSRPSPTRRR